MFYSVTDSKKVHNIDIENVPTNKQTREMTEFTKDEVLYRIEFFNRSKFVLVCAVSRKCLVVSYNIDRIPNRVVNVGFDMIGDVFLTEQKFFGVTHPQKKIISYFEVAEKECATTITKKCEPFDIRFSESCNPNYTLGPGDHCHCILGWYKVGFSGHAECRKCHASCKKWCEGPGEDDCTDCYRFYQSKDGDSCKCRARHGYYDKQSQLCLKCPGPCLDCNPLKPEECVTCKLHYKKDPISKKCFNCNDKTRPKHLFTKDCMDHFQVIPTKVNILDKLPEFADNDLFIGVKLDRQTLSTKAEPEKGVYRNFNDLAWLQILRFWLTVEDKPDKPLAISYLKIVEEDDNWVNYEEEEDGQIIQKQKKSQVAQFWLKKVGQCDH